MKRIAAITIAFLLILTGCQDKPADEIITAEVTNRTSLEWPLNEVIKVSNLQRVKEVARDKNTFNVSFNYQLQATGSYDDMAFQITKAVKDELRSGSGKANEQSSPRLDGMRKIMRQWLAKTNRGTSLGVSEDQLQKLIPKFYAYLVAPDPSPTPDSDGGVAAIAAMAVLDAGGIKFDTKAGDAIPRTLQITYVRTEKGWKVADTPTTPAGGSASAQAEADETYASVTPAPMAINPATGLPMVGGTTAGVDVAGNPYGVAPIKPPEPPVINPTTALPMVGAVDVGGTPFGVQPMQ